MVLHAGWEARDDLRRVQSLDRLSEALFHLQSLTGQYASHPTSRAAAQWRAVYGDVTRSLERHSATQSEQQLYRRLTENADVVGDLFDQLEGTSSNDRTGADTTRVDLRSVLRSQLSVTLQTMVADVNSWYESVYGQMTDHVVRGGIAFLALLASLGGFVVAVNVLGRRRVIAPLARLQEGMERVAGGDLDFRFEPERDDEIGVVARAFDRMTGELDEHILAQRRTERRLQRILDTVAEGILFTDDEGNFRYANPAAEEILGLERSAIEDRTYRDPEWEIRAPDGGPFPEEELPVAQVLRTGSPVTGVEHSVQRPDGSRTILRVNAAPVRRDGNELQGVVASLRDITEQKQFEAQLEHQALHDHLTNLPNRLLFQDRLQHALERSERTGESLAVLFIDLKRFKVINDSLGHDAGDRVLEQVADRLRDTVRDQDTVSRLGGDEFTVLLESVGSVEHVESAARRVAASFRPPFELETNNVTVDASIGIAIHSAEQLDEGVDADALIRRADRAMYQAKREPGTAFTEIRSLEDEPSSSRLERESRLRSALEADDLETAFHGMYELASGRLQAVEALARWRDPEMGEVRPAEFIPLAEETGLIVQLGHQQMLRACRRLLEAGDELSVGGHLPRLNVNLSSRQLEDPGVVERVREILEETGFPAGRLFLEVTESAAMRESDTVSQLKDLGVGLAVDDFGTRYSTLAQVQKLEVDELKIDRSFVAGLPGDRKDRAIVETVVTLGQALGLNVVAEGVETEEQLAAVREFGCDSVQGFYFGEPTARLKDISPGI